MKKVKTVTILLLILCMTLLTGCWNYREAESLSIVAGVAIDPGEKGQKFHMTFEIIDMSGNTNGQPSSKLVETEGDTIFDAARNAVKKCKNKLFFNECKIVVLNSQIAQKGIIDVIDWFNRDAEPRLTLVLAVSQSKTAKDILKSQSLTNTITSFEISNIINNNNTDLSKALCVKLYEADDILTADGVSLALPAITTEMEEEKENPESGQSSSQSGSSQPEKKAVEVPTLSGTAVFKGDKLVGYLNSEETKYLLFIKNKISGGLIVIDNKDTGNGATLEIENNNTTLKPVVSNGHVKMQINIKCTAALGENDMEQDYDNSKGLEILQKYAQQTLEKHIKELISSVQTKYDSDIFGFGNTIYHDNYSSWQELKPKWEETFKSLQCDVKAEVEIKSTSIEKSKIRSVE